MGIVNVTPDSFSDGGLHADTDSAVAHGLLLAGEGAAHPRHRRRVDPARLAARAGRRRARPRRARHRASRRRARRRCCRSTRPRRRWRAPPSTPGRPWSTTSRRCAAIRRWPALVAERGCPVCLMHMLGEPRTMQDDPRYDDVVAEVAAFLEERLAAAVAAGVREEQVLLDPGIGFGKTVRAQPPAAAPSRPHRRAGPAARPGRLAQALHRRAAGRRAARAGQRHRGDDRARPGARRGRRARARRAAQRRGAARRKATAARPWSASMARAPPPPRPRHGAQPAPQAREALVSEPGGRSRSCSPAVEAPCHCGVTDEERREAQTLLLDVRLTPLLVTDYAADDIAGTVDYGAVAASPWPRPPSGPTGCSSAWRPRSPTGSGRAHELAELHVVVRKPSPGRPAGRVGRRPR